MADGATNNGVLLAGAIDAEQALLGAVLINNDALRLVEGIVHPDDFSEPLHRHLWQVMLDLERAGKRIDPRLLATFIGPDAAIPLEVEGGKLTVKQYIARLAAEAITIIDAPHYAAAIRGIADQNRMAEIGAALRHEIPVKVEAVASDAIDKLDALLSARTHSATPGVTFRQALTSAVDATAAAYQLDGRPTGIPYGLADLDRLTSGMQSSELIVMAGRPGMGKFQPVYSPVLTPDGWRQLGDLAVGDKVIGHDGHATRVTGVYPQGIKPIFRVFFADGRSTLVGAEHLWEVHSKHWSQPRVIETKEIARLLALVRYRKRLHVPLFEEAPGSDVLLPVPPYTMGAWLGAGSADTGRITKDDDWLFERIAADGYRVGPKIPTRTIYGLIAGLRSAGVAECHSFDKFIPESYRCAARSQRLQLLNGLLDTDGTVEQSGTIRYSTSSGQMARDVQALVWSLGGICKIYHKATPQRAAFILTIRHPTPRLLVTMPRKAARLPISYQYSNLKLRIERIEAAGTADCRCISVENPRGLYVTDDYILTHNTALGLGVSRNVADAGKSVLYYSLEMADVALAHRVLSDVLYDRGVKLPYWALRAGKMTEREFESMTDTAKTIESLPIKIEQQPGLTMAQIAARARQHKRRHGLDLLVVDHMHLIRPSERYAGHRVEEIGEVTRGLKGLAKELAIPVLALCQLSRAVEQREDKRPNMSDLRGSGDIEQDADVIIMLYREAYYLLRSKPNEGNREAFAEWLTECDSSVSKLEVIIEKQRSGPTGTVNLFCSIEHNAVRNAASIDQLPADVAAEIDNQSPQENLL